MLLIINLWLFHWSRDEFEAIVGVAILSLMHKNSFASIKTFQKNYSYHHPLFPTPKNLPYTNPSPSKYAVNNCGSKRGPLYVPQTQSATSRYSSTSPSIQFSTLGTKARTPDIISDIHADNCMHLYGNSFFFARRMQLFLAIVGGKKLFTTVHSPSENGMFWCTRVQEY